jgi:hypothetical protein
VLKQVEARRQVEKAQKGKWLGGVTNFHSRLTRKGLNRHKGKKVLDDVEALSKLSLQKAMLR